MMHVGRCLALVATILGSHRVSAEPPLIAAAANLRFALPQIAQAFERETGVAVKVVYGSTGNFRYQIAQGAPFELFLSADEESVMALARDGHAIDEGALYAIGRLAVITAVDSPIKPDPELKDLGAALADGRLKRLAIANPEHAPYGRRAVEALRHAGLWDRVQGRLVLGENVAQAAQFALSGSAQAGIVAYSAALSPEISGKARYALIPADWHQPLRQRMVLLKRAGEDARMFYAFMQRPQAHAILARFGFAVPGEGRGE